MYTPDEVKTAHAIRDKVINGEIPHDLQSIYAAGMIVMWEENRKQIEDLKAQILDRDKKGLDNLYIGLPASGFVINVMQSPFMDDSKAIMLLSENNYENYCKAADRMGLKDVRQKIDFAPTDKT